MPGITNHYFDTYADARTARRLLAKHEAVSPVTYAEHVSMFTFYTYND